MSISFRCTGCEKMWKVKDELAGKRGKCPGCGQTILIPAGRPDRVVPSPEHSPIPHQTKTGVNLQAPATGQLSPPRQRATPGRWLLRSGLSAVAAVILGAIGFGIADAGFMLSTQTRTTYSASGEPTTTGNATLAFYGIVIIQTNDIESFQANCRRTGLQIVVTVTGFSGLCGGGLAFLALRRLTRPKGVVGNSGTRESRE